MFYFYFFVLLKAGIWKPSGLFKQNLLSINKTNFSNNRTFLSYASTKAFSFSLESVITQAERATIHFYIPKTKDWCFKWKNESVDESTCIACRRLLACTKRKSSTGTNLYMIFFFFFYIHFVSGVQWMISNIIWITVFLYDMYTSIPWGLQWTIF